MKMIHQLTFMPLFPDPIPENGLDWREDNFDCERKKRHLGSLWCFVLDIHIRYDLLTIFGRFISPLRLLRCFLASLWQVLSVDRSVGPSIGLDFYRLNANPINTRPRCVLMWMEWLYDDVLYEIVLDLSFDSLKNIDRQIDGLTDQWTYWLS